MHGRANVTAARKYSHTPLHTDETIVTRRIVVHAGNIILPELIIPGHLWFMFYS